MTLTKRLVVDQAKLRYEGLFDMNELWRLIDGWFYEKHWDKHEEVNSEFVRPNGKQINIVMRPWKSISDWHKIWMHVRINVHDLQKREIELDGTKTTLDYGRVFIIIDGYVWSDRKGNWKNSIMKWFVHMMAELYFFKPVYSRAEAWILSDVEDFRDKIKRFLNFYQKYEQGALVPFMKA